MASWQAPQLFGSLASSAAEFSTFIPATQTLSVGYAQRFGYADCERLWRIRSSGIQVLRNQAQGGIGPLTREQITNVPQLPAGASRSTILAFKKQIKIQSRTEQTNIILDIGQSIEIYGFSVDIDVIGPLGTVEISLGVPTSLTVTQTGLVVDAVLAVEILAIEAPLGKRSGKLTQHVVVPANSQLSVAVPTGAIRARILQTGAGAASALWTRFLGDPAIHTSIATGLVTFTGRISDVRATELGDATHFQTDLDANAARFFTIIWEIEP